MRKSNVASICQGRDTQSLFGSQEFVGILERNVSDANLTLVLLSFPVDPCVLGPREIAGVFDLVIHTLKLDVFEDLPLPHMDGHEGLYSDPYLSVHVLKAHLREVCENTLDVLALLFKFNNFLLVRPLKTRADHRSPENLNAYKGDLRWILQCKLLCRKLEAISGSFLAKGSDG